MQRREFIKKTTLLGGILILNPNYSLKISEEFSTEELIGKGSPKLYGEGFKLREERGLLRSTR